MSTARSQLSTAELFTNSAQHTWGSERARYIAAARARIRRAEEFTDYDEEVAVELGHRLMALESSDPSQFDAGEVRAAALLTIRALAADVFAHSASDLSKAEELSEVAWTLFRREEAQKGSADWRATVRALVASEEQLVRVREAQFGV